MRILHLSADYPDPLAPAKTRAVSNLLELAGFAEHRVYSLNRVGWRAGVHAVGFGDAGGEDHRAVAYGAPGKGVLLRTRLERLADWILDEAARAGFAPDLVHAHKLSVEGVAGLRIARALGVPLMVSSQGNTDVKIVGARRDLRPLYRAIWRDAAAAFPFAPWTRAALDRLLGERRGHVAALPCPGPADAILAPRRVGPLARSAFHMAGARNKNADGLIRAVARAAAGIPEIRLEIIGGGDPAGFAWVAAEAARLAPDRVALLGPRPHDAMQALYNGAGVVAMVSHRESFGMVFAEALRAGAPCLIPRGRGVDGYFEEGVVVVAADPSDDAEIADGLARLMREEDAFKARLAALGQAGGLDFLARPAIRDAYRAGCAAALGRPVNA